MGYRRQAWAFLFLAACGGPLAHDSPFDPEAPLTRQERGRVSGAVTLEGETDHAQVSVQLQNERGTYSVQTATDGSYEITGVVPGTYELRFGMRSFAATTAQIVVSLGESVDVAPVVLAPKTSTVTGTAKLQTLRDRSVVEVGGARLAFVRVKTAKGTAIKTAASPAPAKAEVVAATSNADGGFAVSLPSGTWAIYAPSDAAEANAQGNAYGLELGKVAVDGEVTEIEAGDFVVPVLTGFVEVEGATVDGPSAVFTSTPVVTLRLTASGAAQMRVGVAANGAACVPGALEAYVAQTSRTLVEEGSNEVCVRFVDAEGNETPLLTDTIMFDRTGPVVSLFAIDGGRATSNDAAGRVGLNVAAADALAPLRWMKVADLGGGDCAGALSAVTAEAFVSNRVWTLTNASVDQGERWVCVAVADALSNWSAPVSDAIEYDTQPPVVVSGLAIDGGAAATNQLAVTVTAAVEGAAEMLVAVDGDFAGARWERYAPSTIVFLPDIQGSHAIGAYYRDAAGNQTAISSDTIMLDTVAPSSPAVALQPASDYTTSATVTLALSAVGADGVVLSNDGFFDTEPVEAYVTSYPGWTLGGADGAKTIYAKFVDDAGNAAPVVAVTVVLDRQAPLGSAPVIAGGGRYTRSPLVTLTLPASGADEMYVSNAPCETGGAWSGYIPTLAWALPANDGVHWISTRYRDAAGNRTPCFASAVTLDTVVYAPAFTAAVAGSGGVSGRTNGTGVTVFIGGASTDVTAVRIANDVNVSAAAPQPVAGSYPWSLIAGDGLKFVYLELDDAAGNRAGPYAVAITLDTTPPEAPNLTLADVDGDGFTLDADSVELAWTTPADPNLAGYELERFIPGVDAGYVSVASLGAAASSFVDGVTASTGHPHYYRIRASDDVGNRSSWSSTVIAYPFEPIESVAWLRTAGAYRYLFPPRPGTFSLRPSFTYESFSGVPYQMELVGNATSWDRADTLTGTFGDTLSLKTLNQDNSLAFTSIFPLQVNQRTRLGRAIQWNDVALDAQGRPVIAFDGYTNTSIAAWDGATWTTTPLNAYAYQVGIGIDAGDKLHVAYTTFFPSPMLWYATNASGTWAFEQVTAPANSYVNLGVAVEASGRPHILYTDGTNLWYAVRNAGTWSIQNLGSGRAPSIAVDPAGKAHITYHRPSGGGVYYAENVGGAWASTLIQSGAYAVETNIIRDGYGVYHAVYCSSAVRYATSSGGWAPSLVTNSSDTCAVGVDRARKVYVAFAGADGTMKLGVKDGTWSFRSFDVYGNGNDRVSVAVDDAGNAHVSYVNGNLSQLRYYRYAAATEDLRALSNAGASGNAVAVSATGATHLAYVGYGKARYASDATGTWQSTPLDVVDTYVLDVALTPWGEPRVAYEAYTANQVRFATKAPGGSWSAVTVATGTRPSLAIDDLNTAHVLYTGAALNYASLVSGGAWSSPETVLTGCYPGQSLALDDQRRPHATCGKGSPGLFHVWRTGPNAWTSEKVADGFMTVAAVAVTGTTVHMAWIDSNTNGLYYGRNAGSGWSKVLVDARANIGTPKLAVDAAGRAFITYYDANLSQAWFVTNASGAWAGAPIATPSTYGAYDIGLDEAGSPVLSYGGTFVDAAYALHVVRRFFGVLTPASVVRTTAW